MTDDAAKSILFVTYPNGTSKKMSRLNISPKVLDGSIITVGRKEDVEPFNFTQYVTNVTTIWADITQAWLMVVLALRR